jgi:hypothetical protein
LALGLPGEPVTAARIEQLLTAARKQKLAAVELLAFEWAGPSLVKVAPLGAEPSGPQLIPIQAGRGLFEPSVRSTAWIDGGVAVCERPELVVEVSELDHARLRIELVDVRLRRPEHLPDPLRGRGFAERVLGWSIADAATPTQPMFVAARGRARDVLSLRAELPAGTTDLVLAIEDVCGHRHVRQLTR